MRVLKVVVEGVTTSFRYPHFMLQIHPTYQVPPPSTIYGHVASALGEWFDPTGVQFAYHFTHANVGQVKDVEHIIVLSPAAGYLPGTRTPKVLEGNVNPFERDLLFRPRLTLYLNRPDWESAFRSPRFAVVLGRSQDLFTYTDIQVVDLEHADRAYFEHTLLPYSMAPQIGRGVAVTMPRYLDYSRRREPTFDRYLVLHDRVRLPPEADALQFAQLPYGPYWIDPTSPTVDGLHLGLAFHTFTGGQP